MVVTSILENPGTDKSLTARSRSRRRGYIGMAVRSDRVVNRRKARRFFRAAPHRHRELSSRTKNAPRLCQSARLIGDMAHAKVRHYDVKFGVAKRKARAPASPAKNPPRPRRSPGSAR